jgi:hypothetical protein
MRHPSNAGQYAEKLYTSLFARIALIAKERRRSFEENETVGKEEKMKRGGQ